MHALLSRPGVFLVQLAVTTESEGARDCRSLHVKQVDLCVCGVP